MSAGPAHGNTKGSSGTRLAPVWTPAEPYVARSPAPTAPPSHSLGLYPWFHFLLPSPSLSLTGISQCGNTLSLESGEQTGGAR